MSKKKVDFDHWMMLKIAEAVESILAGTCSKVIINDNVKVYQCKNIVRIDLKIEEDN